MAGYTGAKTLYIEPGSPWENGYGESFNSKLGERVPEWRDLLFVEGGAGAGKTLAGSLQHHPSTLFRSATDRQHHRNVFQPATVFSPCIC
jgi:hypothetical protein